MTTTTTSHFVLQLEAVMLYKKINYSINQISQSVSV